MEKMEFEDSDMTLSQWSDIRRSCTRKALLTLNGVCMLIALFTMSLALVDSSGLKQFGRELAMGPFTSDLMIIVACLLLIGACAIGTAGVYNGNMWILRTFAGFLLILVVLELLIAAYVVQQRYSLESSVEEWKLDDFFRNFTNSRCARGERWNDLQTTYECCGLNGPGDYQAAHMQISLSCCPGSYHTNPDNKQSFYKNCIQSSSYYNTGCRHEILIILRSKAVLLVGMTLMCLCFEVACILLVMQYTSFSNNGHACYNDVEYSKTIIVKMEDAEKCI